MRNSIHTVLTYFGSFEYAPSYEEIFTFFPKKINKKTLKIALKNEEEKGKVVRIRTIMNRTMFGPLQRSPTTYNPQPTTSFYTLPQYSIPLAKSLKLKAESSREYIHINFQIYLSILRVFPLVQFVGITGASAMHGLRKNDDIDLCIVTKKGSLWTTRFIVIILAKLLGIHGGMGVCLNLFFDESDLAIYKRKQNSYIAHEILQMKTLVDKDKVFIGFLSENIWIQKYFPNYIFVIPGQAGIQTLISIQKKAILDWIPASAGMTHIIEKFFKLIQLPIIKRNKTSLLITPTQLWLFKNDYEKKLKRKGLVL